MFNSQEIESKWIKYWDENKTYKTENEFSKPKWYSLDMFPYPSGAGLHVGHPKGYTANDIVARYKKAKGFNVLHPIGWDAFGLPAENYAIKTGTHPRITTDSNIQTFKRQIKALGFSYDWDREIDTTDPKYYKWTQWIFLKLFEKGLAYEQDMPINYCPSCKTGLANEEVLNDFTCERCGSKVEKKRLRQWVLAITKYAERLANDVDKLDWPEGIKEMQKNWIGRSEGCEFEMKKAVENKPLALILHGWKDTESGWKNHNWALKLQDNLEALGYDVQMPTLPNPHKPDVEAQLEFLKQYENKVNEDTIVIGHSMGGHLAMHFVEKLNKKINKVIAVAPCFNGLVNHIDWSDWTGAEEGIASMKIDYDTVKIRENVNEIKAVLSKNDPLIPYELAKSHFDESGIEHIAIENAGHFMDSDGVIEIKEVTDELTDSIRVYTTRIDTVFGMTYAVLAPDHRDVYNFITEEQKEACEAYIDEANGKSDLDRTELAKEKTGVFTGSYIINPFSGKKVPLWIGDYVLGSYGTGAVMAVPAHDERDFEFAKKYNLDIEKVILSEKENTEYDELANIIEKEEEKGNEDLSEYTSKMEEISKVGEKPVTEDGVLFAAYMEDEKLADAIDMTSKEARDFLIKYAGENNFGELKVNFKLRDWLFSRQRYWGEPIPLIHLENSDVNKLPRISDLSEAEENNAYVLKKEATNDSDERILCSKGKERYLVVNKEIVSGIYEGINGKIVCDYRLPLELPEVENYEPAGDGNSPLAMVEDFVNVKLADNLSGKRETNTMPQWGGSCWYYLRYMDNLNEDNLVAPEVADYWGEVDSYVGGAEHAVLHLLYARFWHKFLFDIGVVPSDEPFYRLRNQGLILGMGYFTKEGGVVANDLVEIRDEKFYHKETGEELTEAPTKMSKSLKNVVNPDDIISEFGADTLRMYEMYLADFKDAAPWDTKAIVGVKRFLDRVWNNVTGEQTKFAKDDAEAIKEMHKAIKKVGEDIESYKFNTAISAMMIMLNAGVPNDEALAKEWKENLVVMLGCFAPFISEELWEKLGHKESVFLAKWPEFDESKLVENTVTLGISINGKVRDQISLPADVSKDDAIKLAKETEGAKKWIEGKEIIKEIYVPGKLINIVVKG